MGACAGILSVGVEKERSAGEDNHCFLPYIIHP